MGSGFTALVGRFAAQGSVAVLLFWLYRCAGINATGGCHGFVCASRDTGVVVFGSIQFPTCFVLLVECVQGFNFIYFAGWFRCLLKASAT